MVASIEGISWQNTDGGSLWLRSKQREAKPSEEKLPSWTPLIHMEAEEAFEVETLLFAGISHCILEYNRWFGVLTTVCRRNPSVEFSTCSHRFQRLKPSALRPRRILSLAVLRNER
jgi:hypothetical protein